MSERLSDSNVEVSDPHSIGLQAPPNEFQKTTNRFTVGCTDWVPYSQQGPAAFEANKLFAANNMISMSESLFWEISNLALVQGRLQRKVLLNNKQEVWRDMYVILEKDRIWMFSQNQTIRAQQGSPLEKEHLPPTYIPLPSHNKSNSRLMAQILDSNVFSITLSYGVSGSSTIQSVSTAVTLNELTTTLTFRTKSMETAEHWVKTVYRVNERIRLQLTNSKRSSDALNGSTTTEAHHHHKPSKKHSAVEEELTTDNDIIAGLDATIAKAQSVVSDEEIQLTGRLSTFEGMLHCSYLRGYFQKYLMTESLEETLLFWEYAEDFRRGHPLTRQPFPFALAESSRVDSTDGVRQWAESIYGAFVEAYAFFQVSQCNTAELDRIGDMIKGRLSVGGELIESETDDQRAYRLGQEMLPPDLFDPIQTAAFRTMKYNFYPEFVKQPNYYKLLRAALHTYQRAQKRLTVFAGFLHSDVEPPSARGIVLQPATDVVPIPAKAGAPVRFPVFNFMTRGKQSAAANGKGDKDKDSKASAPELVMVTPWRKRMSTARTERVAAEQRIANSKTWGVQRMMASSALAKRSKVTWMPDWWWDYAAVEPVPQADNEAIKNGWVEEELRLNAEAALRAKKHKSAARKQKTAEREAAAAANGSVKTEEASDSESEEEKPKVDTAGNPMLYALAQEGFDSDNSFDASKSQEVIGAAKPSPVHKRKSLQIEEPSSLEYYNTPAWLPSNVDIVREEVEQKIQAYNALLSTRSDLVYSVHRDLLRQMQAREACGDGASTTRLSDGGTSLVSTSHSSGVYRPQPAIQSTAADSNVGASESKTELRRAFMATNFTPYQPASYLSNPGLPSVGTVVLSAGVRCRYIKRKPPKGPPLVSSNINTPTSGASFSVRYGNSFKGNPLAIEGSSNAANLSALRDAVDSNGASAESPTNHSPHTNASATPGRRRSPSDEFLGQGVMGVEWVKQYALITVFLGEARICLYDPHTLLQTCNINLTAVTKIAPSVQQLHSIDIMDCFGLNWQLMPEGVDEDDCRNSTKRWLDLLAIITLPSTEITYIIKSGYISKRGRYNKAFKQRWFVLTSDYRMRYYKDDSPSSQYKGEIHFERTTTAYDIIRFNKEIIMNMKKLDRTFILMAEDAKLSEEWVQLIYQLLLIRDSTPAVSSARSNHELTGTIPEADEEDDEDED